MLRERGEKSADGKWFSAPAERNKGPILEVLARVLPASGLALEIASGTGQHAVHFARGLPGLTWQPSDPDAEFRRAIALRVAEEGPPNVNAPLDIEVNRLPWGVAAADAVVCMNMIHVAPWPATRALIEGARAVLRQDGVLFLYGPYRRFGGHTSPGNEQFDADLRARNPEWGLRDMEVVAELAVEAGFALAEVVGMPANNFSLVFRKS